MPLLSNNMDIENISITVHKEAMRLTNSAHGYVAELDTETMDLVAHSLTEMMKDGQCNVDTTHKRMTFPKGQDSYNALWGHALNTKNGFYVNNPKEHPAYKGCIPEGHAQIKRYLSVPSVIGGRLIGQIAVANAERDYTDDDLNVIERLAMIYALAVERKRIEEKLKYFNEHLQSMVTTEVEKRRLQEQLLIQQSKMASMGEMISLIAHQWKQPLNAVTLNVQDFRDAYKQGELDDKYIDNIVGSTMQQIDFMAKTIDDFRNFFIPSKKKIRFDVKAAIDELLSMFMHVYIRHNVDVSLKSEQYVLLNVEGYPNEFKQVILNILNNAKEAIVSRKKIEPQIKGDILINICNTEDKSKVIVSIKDNGGGISNDVITKIFEPYFTTKDKEGTGIGKRQVNPIFKKISRGVILV
ncbi:MAG: GAF domain-containing protein [Nitrospirae bacterium YQR-1]